MLGTPIARSAGDGRSLVLIGSERAELRRRNFTLLVKSARKRPEPVDAIRDFERGRPTSFEKFTRIETAALRAAPPEAAMLYLGRDMQLASEHIITVSDPVEDAIGAEEDFQHPADKQQRKMSEYIRTRDAAGLQSVIDTTSAHEIALQRLRHTATNALRALSIVERSGRSWA